MKTLHEVINRSETAAITLLYLSKRERFRREPMRIARLYQNMRLAGVEVNRADLDQLFIDLHEAGVGRLIISRTKPFHFVWAEDYIDVGRRAVKYSMHPEVLKAQDIIAKPNIIRRSLPSPKEIVIVMPNGSVIKMSRPELKKFAATLKNLI